jgi:hypothetical protein
MLRLFRLCRPLAILSRGRLQFDDEREGAISTIGKKEKGPA